MLEQNQDEIGAQIQYRLIEQLSEAERRYRELVENLNEIVFSIDSNGTLTFINQAWKKELGHDIEDCLSCLLESYVVVEDRHIISNGIPAGIVNEELRLLNDVGEMLWFSISMHATADNSYTGSLHNINDRKLAETRIALSESRYRGIFNSTPVGLLEVDLSASWERIEQLRSAGIDDISHYLGEYPESIKQIMRESKILDLNSATLKMFGAEDKQHLLRSLKTIYTDTSFATYKAFISAIANKHHYFEVESQEKSCTGKTIHTLISCTLPRNENELHHLLITIMDITERKKMEREILQYSEHLEEEVVKKTGELVSAMQEAESANKAKSAFIANMSHEIRTPLTAIIGFAEASLESGQTVEERLAGINIIKKNGHHLLHIINEILDLSKIESGKLELEKMDVSLFDLVHDVESLLRIQAQDKGLIFKVDYSFPLPRTIQTDPTRTKQVLLNLGSNAIKFTKMGKVCIKVSCDYDGQSVVFKVIDTGIGLSPEQIGKLFNPFIQGDESTTRKYGGTGLGLCISKQLAERLGGTITVDSTPGLGSEFQLSIASGDLSGQALIQDLSVFVNEHTEATNTTGIPQLDGHILLAEDNPDNQELISHYIRKTGAQVSIAENGARALEQGLNTNYDLILMDMQMPIMDGTDCTRQLRRQGCSTPIVALTANATKDDINDCKTAGCNDFLSKPVDWSQFFSTLEKHLHPTDSQHVDTSAIKPQIDEDDERFLQLVKRFVARLPTQVDTINTHFSDKNWPAFSAEVHNLKGLGGGFGYPSLTELANALEFIVKKQAYHELADSMAQLNTLVDRIVRGIDQ